ATSRYPTSLAEKEYQALYSYVSKGVGCTLGAEQSTTFSACWLVLRRVVIVTGPFPPEGNIGARLAKIEFV
ncbi:hypothetical protein, partial [Raoultella planticola]|uniref:hypothetical protein n=1 Tax=Raoultella planticola TaxID=575 RepID=UPI001952EA2F